jgi:hypothetical protein
MKALQTRRLTGPTTGCCTNKASCIEEKQRVKATSCKVYSEKQTKKRTNINIHRHKIGMLVCLILWSRERITQAQYLYSATRNTHTHSSDESPAKTPGSRTENWLSDKKSCLYRGETERKETSGKVHNQLSGILRKANKQTCVLSATVLSMSMCVCLCMCVCGARSNQRQTRHHRSSRVSE